jgi:hypothetical protein
MASFGGVPGTAGATEIDPTTVTVTPSGGTANPELTFSVNLTVSTPPLEEVIFTYTVSGPSFTMDTITLSNSAETGNGAVTDIQNYCFGGLFGPDGINGCTQVNGSLLTLDGIQNNDNTPISGATLLAITDDFTIDPGPPSPPPQGTASGGTFSDQFNAITSTPEPGAFLLTFSGLAFAAVRKLRASHRSF